MSHLPEFRDKYTMADMERLYKKWRKSHPIAPEEQAEEGDIYNSGVVLEYHDAPEDEPDDISPALEHHTAAMLHILALKGADPNLLETTGYQMRQLWKMVLRTINHA